MGELPALPCASAVGDASPAEGSLHGSTPRRWGNCRHYPARRRSGTLPRLKAPCMEARPRRWGSCRHFPARRRSGMLPRLKALAWKHAPAMGNCRCFPARRRSGTLPRLKAPCMEARPGDGELPVLPYASAVGDASPAEGSMGTGVAKPYCLASSRASLGWTVATVHPGDSVDIMVMPMSVRPQGLMRE